MIGKPENTPSTVRVYYHRKRSSSFQITDSVTPTPSDRSDGIRRATFQRHLVGSRRVRVPGKENIILREHRSCRAKHPIDGGVRQFRNKVVMCNTVKNIVVILLNFNKSSLSAFINTK